MNSAVRGDTDVAGPIQFCTVRKRPPPLAPAPSSVPWMLSSTSGVNGAAPAPISIAALMARTFPTTSRATARERSGSKSASASWRCPTTRPSMRDELDALGAEEKTRQRPQ